MQNGDTLVWIIVGFLGQALFSMRFVVQWIASERIKRSIIPQAFWYFSLAGGATLLAYAIHKRDPVFIAGQGLGLFVYLRNIYLIHSGRQQVEGVGHGFQEPAALGHRLDEMNLRPGPTLQQYGQHDPGQTGAGAKTNDAAAKPASAGAPAVEAAAKAEPAAPKKTSSRPKKGDKA